MATATDNTLQLTLEGDIRERYWLAYLLTGDCSASEEAYVETLDFDYANPGYAQFMSEWAKKLIIRSALGKIHRQLRESIARMQTSGIAILPGTGSGRQIENITKKDLERALLAIDTFPRCVVVLTVLERMPVKAVAELLGVDTKLLKAAQVVGLAELTRNMAIGGNLEGSLADQTVTEAV
jgi:DNA-directed RNA polymerase specialized sigma24 family protein